MGKPIPRILGRDASQCGGNRLGQGWQSARLRAPQRVFDFAPHHFDGIEVWRVSRQEPDLGSLLLDEFQSAVAFMWREVVHDHHISSAQCRPQHRLHINAKDFRIGRGVNRHAGGGAIDADGTDHRGRLPAPLGNGSRHSLATLGAPAQAGQVGLGPRFIQKD